MMRKLLTTLSIFMTGLLAYAQLPDPVRDSVVIVPVPQVNEDLREVDVFGSMPENFQLNSSIEVATAARELISQNKDSEDQIEGYRIRIYLDNKQDAREKSEEAEIRFRKLFPGYGTYRSFNYPNFKVTVGDFRTKTDAQRMLAKVLRYFPSAFVVKEKTGFTLISESMRFRTDTIHTSNTLEENIVNE